MEFHRNSQHCSIDIVNLFSWNGYRQLCPINKVKLPTAVFLNRFSLHTSKQEESYWLRSGQWEKSSLLVQGISISVGNTWPSTLTILDGGIIRVDEMTFHKLNRQRRLAYEDKEFAQICEIPATNFGMGQPQVFVPTALNPIRATFLVGGGMVAVNWGGNGNKTGVTRNFYPATDERPESSSDPEHI